MSNIKVLWYPINSDPEKDILMFEGMGNVDAGKVERILRDRLKTPKVCAGLHRTGLYLDNAKMSKGFKARSYYKYLTVNSKYSSNHLIDRRFLRKHFEKIFL